jgi:hypothetical protein
MKNAVHSKRRMAFRKRQMGHLSVQAKLDGFFKPALLLH